MGGKLKWILLAIVGVEIALLVAKVLPVEWTALLIALTEGTALALTLSVFVPRAYSVRRRVKNGVLITVSILDEFREVIPSPLLKLAAYEIGMFSSIIRFIRRKIDVPSNSIAMDYGSSFRMMGFVLIALTPIEILLIDALCRKYIPSLGYVRGLLVVLSLYACIWIVGMLFSTKVFPHYLNEEKLVIRYGHMHRIVIPISCIKGIDKVKTDCKGLRTVYYDGEMLVVNNGMRECEIRLEVGSASLIEVDESRCDEDIRFVSFSVDEPSLVKKVVSERLVSAL